MSKGIFLLSTFLFLNLSLFSQSHGYLAAGAGVSFPVADFASNYEESNSPGYARPGLNTDISYAKTFREKFIGLCGTYRYQRNTVDEHSLEKHYSQKFGGIWNVETSPWKGSMLLLGPYFRLLPPGSQKLTCDFKLLIGMNNVTSPQTTITQVGYQDILRQEEAKARALALGAALGIKADVSDALCVIVQLDYVQSKAIFEDVRVVTSSSTINTHDEQIIQVLALTVSLGIKFD